MMVSWSVEDCYTILEHSTTAPLNFQIYLQIKQITNPVQPSITFLVSYNVQGFLILKREIW